jgi:DNA invertase Pin-like site-specific DNA recombinase
MTNHQTSSTFTERPTHIGYMRVSRPSQNEGHISFDIQKKCIRSYSKEIGAKAPLIFHDTGTGVNSAFVRPGLIAAIKQCAKENAILVVMSVDRLARSLDVLELLNGHAVSVVSVQEGAVSAEGRLVPLLEKAQGYSAEISRRSTAAHRAKRASGPFAPFLELDHEFGHKDS